MKVRVHPAHGLVGVPAGEVVVESLGPSRLAALARDDVDAALIALDAPLRRRYATAYKNGEKLRFVARLEQADAGVVRASVGLEALPVDHPLAGGAALCWRTGTASAMHPTSMSALIR